MTLQLHNSQQENGSFAMIWSKHDEKNTYRTISVFTQIEEIAMSVFQFYNKLQHMSPYSNGIFMLRLEGVLISYPQPLLNLWVDFNANFRHSSTYIGDVHLYKCYLRFDYFQLFWFPILKNVFCHTILEGVPITYPLSVLDL